MSGFATMCCPSMKSLADPPVVPNRNVPPRFAWPVVSVSPSVGERLVCNGRPLDAFGIGGSYRVQSRGELLAIYRDVGESARAEVVLCGP